MNRSKEVIPTLTRLCSNEDAEFHRGLPDAARRRTNASAAAGGVLRKLALYTLLAGSSLISNVRADDKLDLHWQGKSFTAAKELPEKLSPAARAAVVQWTAWCAKNEYRIDIDAQGRALLITSTKSGRAETALKALGKTESWFDAALPAPDRSKIKLEPTAASPSSAGGSAGRSGEIPEDPESAPVGAPPPPKNSPAKSWGAGSLEPDSACAVMFVLKSAGDQELLLAQLVKEHVYLKSWVEEARKETGFVLQDPLCGAYLEAADGQEEWSPDHELVNRVAQLFVLRRFGEQSFWLLQGLAWTAEWSFDGTLFCFPYRHEFVGVGEHTSWPSELRNLFKDHAAKPLALEDLASYKRGKWDGAAAKLCFGLAAFLESQPPAKLARTLEELRQFRDLDNRHPKSDGTWERDRSYEIPAAKQLTIFDKDLGLKTLEAATKWLKTFEPGKKDEKATEPKSPVPGQPLKQSQGAKQGQQKN